MTVEERLERLEVELGRARRGTRWLLVLVGLAVGARLVVGGLAGREAQARAGQTEAVPGEVRAKRFVLEDENGKPCALLSLLKEGPGLFLADENGELRSELTVRKEGPGLVLWDEKEKVLWRAP